jgi:hypothetical protein
MDRGRFVLTSLSECGCEVPSRDWSGSVPLRLFGTTQTRSENSEFECEGNVKRVVENLIVAIG